MVGIDRRRFVQGAALAGLAPMLLPRVAASAFAADGAEALVLVLSDLHSAYAKLPAALGAVDAVLARHRGVPALAVINGDLFERGNAVALRSAGEADLAFVKALAARLPVIVNLGNHETALNDDMAETVHTLEAAGASVISSMKDKRSGKPFAPAQATRAAGKRRFVIAGIATDDLATYRQAARPFLDIPAPAAYAAASLKGLLKGADIPVVLSHAGILPDREILASLGDGTLLVGGHDHLRFSHRQGATLYLHTGSYLTGLVAVTVRSAGGRRQFEAASIEPDAGAGDAALLERIARLTAQHLTEAEKAVAATLARPLALGEAARLLVRAMAASAGAEAGLINHTTLGAGLPKGGVTAHDLSNFIRFDGTLFRAEIDADGLAALLDAANQDGDMPLARRSGDFLYAFAPPPLAGKRYALVTNGWVKLNAKRYLGREDLVFTELPDKKIRAAFEQALRGA